jgi:hypothetical protein
LTEGRLGKLEASKENVVINWGNSEPPAKVLGCTLINQPDAIKKAVNKLSAFEAMFRVGVLTPAYTESEEVARTWVKAGHKVVARHVLTGSGGEGIQILESLQDFPCEAPLYTLYVPKKSEWRFHVFDGQAFDWQRKMRRKDFPDDKVNWLVRNHNNGFIFGRNEEEPIDPGIWSQMAKVSVSAVKALGLDFGAVDVIYNERQKAAFVLEVNTAPGLEGTTLFNYAEAFAKFFHGREHPNLVKKAKSVEVPLKRFAFDFAVQKDAGLENVFENLRNRLKEQQGF